MNDKDNLLEFKIEAPEEGPATLEEFVRAFNIPDGELTPEAWEELSNGKGDDEYDAVPTRSYTAYDYSNSQLVDHIHWSPNHSGIRSHAIDIITIHMVVAQCTVETLGNIFAPTNRQASSNYGVGLDGRIGQYVEEKNRSWCSSSSWNDNRAITIETASDNYAPYCVTNAAYAALINLCADICKRNGKKRMEWYPTYDQFITHYGEDSEVMYMTLHKWFAGTGCPGEYLQERMGAIAVAVNAKLGQSTRFSDVSDSASYAKPVYWAVDNDIVKGYNDGTFRPDNKCTRAQFVTMIWRMCGRPEFSSYGKGFSDVDPSMSSYKPIMWGVDSGIIKGYKDGRFGPDDYVTRSQVVTMMWRLCGRPESKFKTNFSDVKSTMSAYKAIAWGEEQGIVHGYKDGRFGPDDACKRSQAVTFLYRLAKKYGL